MAENFNNPDGDDDEVNKLIETFIKLPKDKQLIFSAKVVDHVVDDPEISSKINQNITDVLKKDENIRAQQKIVDTLRHETKEELNRIADELESIFKVTGGFNAAGDGAKIIGNAFMLGGALASFFGYTNLGEMASVGGERMDMTGSVMKVGVSISEIIAEMLKRYNVKKIISSYNEECKKLNESVNEMDNSINTLNFRIGSLPMRSRKIILSMACPILSTVGGEMVTACKSNWKSTAICIEEFKYAYSVMKICEAGYSIYRYQEKVKSGKFSEAAEEIRKLADAL
ncbi:hypothetical protein LOD99_10190 [Oopsacas minuta]|uniref:Uncharacterized protein n=1 Tax=Oopsacas minuta TaxID=111878 RepID=A0AAV7KI74_9METZ|nr:hypothetical protein LOD99_10190 [Oopsacas minuta]